MKYSVAYVQEVAHVVTAENIEAAGALAKRYAEANRLRVLSIYPDFDPLPVQPTNG